MEIYTLHISFPYDEDDTPWSKTVEVTENFTLSKLHTYIQKLVEFDDDHLYDFYVSKNSNRLYNSSPLAKSTKLKDIYPITGHKLYYLFDFGDEWIFQIKKSRKKKTVDDKVKYPHLLESTGVNPEQYPDY